MTNKRSKWPAAQHLLEAADLLRQPIPNLFDDQQDYHHPVADWLDKAALDMAWLAPFRDHEGGQQPWRNATRMAHGLLGIPDPDTCTVCHTRTRPPKEQP